MTSERHSAGDVYTLSEVKMAANDEIIRAALRYTVPNGSACYNVFWFQVSGTPSDIGIANAIETWLEDDVLEEWADLSNSDCQAEDVAIDVINPNGTVDRNIDIRTVTRAGDGTGDTMPPQVAYYARMNTNTPKVRGRKYFPGVNEELVTDGILTVGAQAILAVLTSLLLDSLDLGGTNTLAPGVLSTVTQQFVQFIGSGLADTVTRSQRRRYDDVGI
jgi:hypothetical protein